MRAQTCFQAAALSLCALVAACSGGSGEIGGGTGTTGTTTGTTTGSTTGTTTGTTTGGTTTGGGVGIVSSITLTTGSAQITPGGNVAVRATVALTSGTASGLTIKFSASSGNLSSATAVTDANGVAQVLLTAPTNLGTVALTASTPDGFNANGSVQVVAGPVSSLVVSPTASTTTVAPNAALSVSAQALDANGNPVAGQTVQFSITSNNSGATISPASGTTDANGVASATYTAGNTPGTDTFAVRSGGASVQSRSVVVDSNSITPASVTLTLGATSIAPSTSYAATAKVLDQFGRAVSGKAVNITTSAGTPGSSTVTTDSNGQVSVTLTSPAKTGTVTVTAASSGYSAQSTISVVPGPAQNIVLSTPAPSPVAPGRTTSLTALVRDAGNNAISGKSVVFASSNNQGTFGGSSATQVSVTTDNNGFARTTFQPAGGTGTTATLTAAVTPENVSAMTSVTVDSSAIAPGSLQLSALSPTVQADNKTQPSVRATVLGTDGQALSGVAVSFDSSAPAAASASVTTASDGTAVYNLPASQSPGTSTVTASVGGLRQQVSVQYTTGQPARITVTLNPTTVNSNGTSRLTASVVDCDAVANPSTCTSPRGVPNTQVTFSIKTNSSGGQLAAATATTDVNGNATTTYTAGNGAFTTVADTLQAGVSANSALLATASLNVTVQTASLTLSTKQSSITVNDTSSCGANCNGSVLTANVLDSTGKPVAQAPVTFSTNLGTLNGTTSTTASATTDANGNASVNVVASSKTGSATVSARVGSSLSASTGFVFVAGPANAIAVSASPAAVAPGSNSALTATVTDALGNVVVGDTVQFAVTTNNSTATLSGTRATTTVDGLASTVYTAGTGSGASAVTDVVTATTSTGKSTSVQLSVSPGNTSVSKLTLALSNASISADAGSVSVSATVLDGNGRPASGQTVAFTTSRGSLASATATSNSNGVASVALNFPAGSTAAGTVTVSAKIGALVDQQTLTITPGVASSTNSVISATPSALPADGTSSSTITVLLKDASSNPLPDGTSVTLLTTAGTLASNTATLASGRATFTLKAPSSAATATVSVQGLSSPTASIVFSTSTSGDPASIRVVASSTRIAVTGTGQNDLATLTFTVLDSSGNVIKDDTTSYAAGVNNLRVSFIARPNGGENLTGKDANGATANSGAANFVDVRTQSGVAVVTLQSGTRSGVVEVQAAVLKFPASNTGSANPTDLSQSANYASTAVVPAISIASGPATTIAFSYPTSNSIVNLGGGTYARKGQVLVSDRFGNAVSDGTVVNLEMLDSAIVHDNTGSTTASSSTLTRSGNSLITFSCATQPTSGSFASNCNVDNTRGATSTIRRNGNDRQLQQGDGVYLQSGSYGSPPQAFLPGDTNFDYDKKRAVASTPTVGTQIPVNLSYHYAVSGGTFWAGAALLGGNIGGVASTASTSPVTTGTTTTTNGVGNFVVTYPANASVIGNGCFGYNSDGSYSTLDVRDAVPQSRQVVVVASAGSSATTIKESDFCFSPIAPLQLNNTAPSSTISLSPNSSSGALTFNLTDCPPTSSVCNPTGDGLPLPLRAVSCGVTITRAAGSGYSVVVSSVLATNLSGTGAIVVTRTDDGTTATTTDSAVVSCAIGTSNSISYTVNPQ